MRAREPSSPNTPHVLVAVNVRRVAIQHGGCLVHRRDEEAIDEAAFSWCMAGDRDASTQHLKEIAFTVLFCRVFNLIGEAFKILNPRIVHGTAIADGIACGPIELFLRGRGVFYKALFFLKKYKQVLRADFVGAGHAPEDIGGALELAINISELKLCEPAFLGSEKALDTFRIPAIEREEVGIAQDGMRVEPSIQAGRSLRTDGKRL